MSVGGMRINTSRLVSSNTCGKSSPRAKGYVWALEDGGLQGLRSRCFLTLRGFWGVGSGDSGWESLPGDWAGGEQRWPSLSRLCGLPLPLHRSLCVSHCSHWGATLKCSPDPSQGSSLSLICQERKEKTPDR